VLFFLLTLALRNGGLVDLALFDSDGTITRTDTLEASRGIRGYRSAREHPGLVLVVSGLVPSPWSEAAKGIALSPIDPKFDGTRLTFDAASGRTYFTPQP
jgi:hypothetical protein